MPARAARENFQESCLYTACARSAQRISKKFACTPRGRYVWSSGRTPLPSRYLWPDIQRYSTLYFATRLPHTYSAVHYSSTDSMVITRSGKDPTATDATTTARASRHASSVPPPPSLLLASRAAAHICAPRGTHMSNHFSLFFVTSLHFLQVRHRAHRHRRNWS